MVCAFVFTGYAMEPTDTLQFVYKLHGQTRRFKFNFEPENDGGITLRWGIERNLRWWEGTYRMTREAVESGNSLSFMMPEDGNHLTLANNETFAMISREAYRSLKNTGRFLYDGVEYKIVEYKIMNPAFGKLLHVIDTEGAELHILDNEQYPLILEMTNNPLEINWKAEKARH